MSKKSIQDLILDEIKGINVKLDKLLEEKIPEMETNIAVAKTQAGVISTTVTLIGGAIGVAIAWFHK